MSNAFVHAFHQMWGAFPEPAMLIHRDRTVVAVNRLGRRCGIDTGMRCGGVPAGDHLRSAVVDVAESGGKPMLVYWVPVEGSDELMIHFGIGVVNAVVNC